MLQYSDIIPNEDNPSLLGFTKRFSDEGKLSLISSYMQIMERNKENVSARNRDKDNGGRGGGGVGV